MSQHIIKIEKFEGPLDLLLRLIEAQELDISDISLAKITDQYVQYMEQVKLTPSEIADFLVVAAKLLWIKSRLLLPLAEVEEAGEEHDLAQQLRMYQEFLKASKAINALWKSAKTLYSREKILASRQQGFYPPQKLEASDLASAFHGALKKIVPIIKLPEKSLKKVISLKEKIDHVVTLLQQCVSMRFQELLTLSSSKEDRIVSFLACLELVKQQKIIAVQEGVFTDIILKRA